MPVGALGLVGETGAAFIATPVKYGATSTRSHTLHESMLVSSVTFLGLVGSFWHTAFTVQHEGGITKPVGYGIPCTAPSLLFRPC